MDYLDDLDQDAFEAFCELGDEMPSLSNTSASYACPGVQGILEAYKQEKALEEAQKPSAKCGSEARSRMYLFKFSSPVTPAVLASAAILTSQPDIVVGEGEDGVAQFCQLDEQDMYRLQRWLAADFPLFRPIFAPINKAYKELCPFSAYPTLGLDATMPQHRPDATTSIFLPAQDQYPVWYFFYGTLADSKFLSELLCVEKPKLTGAAINGGAIRTWGKKYLALVDSPSSQVGGWAYQVMSKEQEDALLVYETAKYEVVRVAIAFKGNDYSGQVVKGCTFRFAGEDAELD